VIEPCRSSAPPVTSSTVSVAGGEVARRPATKVTPVGSVVQCNHVRRGINRRYCLRDGVGQVIAGGDGGRGVDVVGFS